MFRRRQENSCKPYRGSIRVKLNPAPPLNVNEWLGLLSLAAARFTSSELPSPHPERGRSANEDWCSVRQQTKGTKQYHRCVRSPRPFPSLPQEEGFANSSSPPQSHRAPGVDGTGEVLHLDVVGRRNRMCAPFLAFYRSVLLICEMTHSQL